ncbi:hypothetical protein Leryth_023281 [Lithospermum erythrorhizon]|nr:hypothetical protein Leryth_023281 [Lithospermum erythrorhizon]
MIKAVMVINTHGMLRFSKFYHFQDSELVSQTLCNFCGAVIVFDSSVVFVETLDRCFNNVCELDIVFNFSKNLEDRDLVLTLAYLNKVHILALSRVLFPPWQMHAVLDEIVLGGQVVETNSSEVMRTVEEVSKLETTSSSDTLISRTVSSWRAK